MNRKALAQLLVLAPFTLLALSASAAAQVSISRVSVGHGGDGASSFAHLWADGRFVVFDSEASNLVADDTNGVTDVFRFDRWTRAMVRIAARPTGAQSWRRSFGGDVSRDGRWVTFDSSSPKLVPNDTNDADDAFVRDMLLEPAASYCTAKTDSQGCVPAIAGAGAASLASATVFELSAAPVLNQRTGVLLWSSDPAAAPYFGGIRCVTAPFQRSAPARTWARRCSRSGSTAIRAIPAAASACRTRSRSWSIPSGVQCAAAARCGSFAGKACGMSAAT